MAPAPAVVRTDYHRKPKRAVESSEDENRLVVGRWLWFRGGLLMLVLVYNARWIFGMVGVHCRI